MTFRPLTPDQLARLSWYQRQRYQRRLQAWQRTLADIDPATPTTLAGREERHNDDARAALRAIIHTLNEALSADIRCGTVAGYDLHQHHAEEPCRDCQRARERQDRRNATDRTLRTIAGLEAAMDTAARAARVRTLVRAGYTNGQIAQELQITRRSVERIRAKHGITSKETAA